MSPFKLVALALVPFVLLVVLLGALVGLWLLHATRYVPPAPAPEPHLPTPAGDALRHARELDRLKLLPKHSAPMYAGSGISHAGGFFTMSPGEAKNGDCLHSDGQYLTWAPCE